MKKTTDFKYLEQIFKALSDATRLKILHMIFQKEMCVYDIYQELDISQPAVSHHLKILKQAGLVKAVKKGKWVFYSIDDEQKISYQFINNLLSENQNIQNQCS